jgi:hypothetical protein
MYLFFLKEKPHEKKQVYIYSKKKYAVESKKKKYCFKFCETLQNCSYYFPK